MQIITNSYSAECSYLVSRKKDLYEGKIGALTPNRTGAFQHTGGKRENIISYVIVM